MAEGEGRKSNSITNATMPILLVGIIVIMVIPVPSFILDILLSLNFTISIVILFVSLYVEKPLQFSVYPALVLITTLFRLAMNISSTRLILLNAKQGLDAAGDVIQAFGNFVVGGNYVVGVVVFIIIMLINFSVITKGSGRIAEVAARFTLDAMPGKQMAIDSDLNNGNLTENDAKKMRRELAQEAEFYGAMDGASKFVRGDAVAGIAICVVNVLGGFFIGIFQLGMDWRKAAQTFTLLTVGDGLVSSLPSLIVSTSAGIIVARATSGADLSTDVGLQLTRYRRPLGLASGVCLLFAIVPGMPFLPFILLSATTAVIALLKKQEDDEALVPTSKMAREKGAADSAGGGAPVMGSTDEVKGLLNVDLLELEVGYELVPMVDASSGGDLIERIRGMRRQFALDLGFIVPAIHIRDNIRLEATQYRVMLKGIEIAKGSLRPNHFLAMDPGGIDTPVPGIPTKEPAFGLDALWIPAAEKERAQLLGYTVVDPPTVVITHITEVIKAYAHEILGRQEVQVLLDTLAKQHPKIVEEVVPALVPLGVLQQVLAALLREGVSIRDLRTILEALADWAPTTKQPDRLVEHVRRALARAITAKHTAADGVLSLVSFAPQIERLLIDSLQTTESGSYLAVEPNVAQRLLAKLRTATERFAAIGKTPVVLTPGSIRGAVFELIERFIPGVAVMSHYEVGPATKVQSLGVISIDDL